MTSKAKVNRNDFTDIHNGYGGTCNIGICNYKGKGIIFNKKYYRG